MWFLAHDQHGCFRVIFFMIHGFASHFSSPPALFSAREMFLRHFLDKMLVCSRM
jgi:hypothetical protein